jgi:hypothetical protein
MRVAIQQTPLGDWACTDSMRYPSCADRFELIIVFGAVETGVETMFQRIETLGTAPIADKL